MSRIYEALKRAESERVLAQREHELRPQQTAEPVASVASIAMLPAMPPPVVTADAVPSAPSGRPAVSGETSAAAAQAALLNLEDVRRRAWSPSVAQLPALLSRGPAVEQFRSLRSRIYEFRDQTPIKSILISSGVPQEGKTFVAANLAISLARYKKSKVLLVDGDMRRGSLHKLFGCDSNPGLVDYLSGKSSLKQVMQQAESRPEAESELQQALANLTFIGAGTNGDQAADLSGSRRFQELVAAAAPIFDWIVVDSSPVVPVSDAVNLARACDGVLLVARSGVTQFTVAQRAQSELRASKILGFVLNAVKDVPAVGGYYNYDSQEA